MMWYMHKVKAGCSTVNKDRIDSDGDYHEQCGHLRNCEYEENYMKYFLNEKRNISSLNIYKIEDELE